jgi:hypothetical protein
MLTCKDRVIKITRTTLLMSFLVFSAEELILSHQNNKTGFDKVQPIEVETTAVKEPWAQGSYLTLVLKSWVKVVNMDKQDKIK